MITSITIKEKQIQRYGFEEDFSKNFDRFILKNLDEDDVIDFAETYLDMIEEGECDCATFDISDSTDIELIAEAKRRGFIIIEPKSITEELHLEEVLPEILKAL